MRCFEVGGNTHDYVMVPRLFNQSELKNKQKGINSLLNWPIMAQLCCYKNPSSCPVYAITEEKYPIVVKKRNISKKDRLGSR